MDRQNSHRPINIMRQHCCADYDKKLLTSMNACNGGKVICIPVALPASTLANTPAEGNQRFYLRTHMRRRMPAICLIGRHMACFLICLLTYQLSQFTNWQSMQYTYNSRYADQIYSRLT